MLTSTQSNPPSSREAAAHRVKLQPQAPRWGCPASTYGFTKHTASKNRAPQTGNCSCAEVKQDL